MYYSLPTSSCLFVFPCHFIVLCNIKNWKYEQDFLGASRKLYFSVYLEFHSWIVDYPVGTFINNIMQVEEGKSRKRGRSILGHICMTSSGNGPWVTSKIKVYSIKYLLPTTIKLKNQNFHCNILFVKIHI